MCAQLDALQKLVSTAPPAPQAAPEPPPPLLSYTSTGNPFASANLDDDPPVWNQPSIPEQPPADRAHLEAQIAQLTADRVTLTAQVVHLTGELEMQVSLCLSEEVPDKPASRDRTPTPSSTGVPPLDTQQRVSAVASEAENAALRVMISELQAQILDFNDADSIIKEWSDYADTLTKEHATLTAQHGGLAAEQVALKNRHASLTLEHESLAKDLGLVSLEKATLASNVESLTQDVEILSQQVKSLQQQGGSLTQQVGGLDLEIVSLKEERQRLSQLAEVLQAQVAGRDTDLELDGKRLDQLVSGLQQQASHREAELAAVRQQLADAEESLGGLKLLLAESREEADTAAGLAREQAAKFDNLQAEFDAATKEDERLGLLLVKVTAQAAAAEEGVKTAAQDAAVAAAARQELEAALAVAVALSVSRALELVAASPSAPMASPETTRSSSLPRPGDRRLAEQVALLSACKAELEAEVADLQQQLLAATTTAAATLQQHFLPEEPSPTPSVDQRSQQAIARRDTEDDVSALAGWDARVELLLRERSVLQATIEGLTAVNALAQSSGPNPLPAPLFGHDSGDLLGLGWSTPTEQDSPRATVQLSFNHGNGSTEREQSLQASLQQAVATNTELKVLVVNLQSELEQAPLVPSVNNAGATVTYRTSQGWGPGGPSGSSGSEDAAALLGIPPSSLHLHPALSPQLDRTASTIVLPAATNTRADGPTEAVASLRVKAGSAAATSTPKGALLLKLERLQQERTILAATVTGLRSEVERLQGEMQELRETTAEAEAHAENVEHSSWQLQEELGSSQQELAGAQSELLALRHLLELAHAARDAAEAAAAVACPRAGSASPTPSGEEHAGLHGVVAEGARGEQAAAGAAVVAAGDAAALWVQVADLQSELELLKGGYAFALEIMRSALGHTKDEIEAGDMDFETALDLTTVGFGCCRVQGGRLFSRPGGLHRAWHFVHREFGLRHSWETLVPPDWQLLLPRCTSR